MEQLLARVDVSGARVLELGSLEGLHALIMHAHGAKEIVSIEARKESFLRCLVVKNAFALARCRFLCGDVREVLPRLVARFDLCLAVGILYHLEDPAPVVYRIGELADRVFIWTHYVPAGKERADDARVRCRGKEYRGKMQGEDPAHYLSGLATRSLWLREADLMSLLQDAGFPRIEVISREEHEHGPAVTLLARSEGV